MGASTNVSATAVGTMAWLAGMASTIAVPVYQRQYRWEIGDCAQLLDDVRAVADSAEAETHFLGSILSSTGDDGLVLIDGQQRLTTLMLLVAAVRHAIAPADPALAAELSAVLTTSAPDRTKLRPHQAWAEVFEAVVLGRPLPDDAGGSRFEENYTYFRSQVGAAEAPSIWRGLQRLEHVAITLGDRANAQQIFESLNSTGAPLRDHELIHNYVLMGLSHDQQREIEDGYWTPIERNAGDAIDAFFRDYLTLTTGREPVEGERSVYDAFRRRFPRVDVDSLRRQAAEWREYSAVYRVLLDPAEAPDPDIAGRLAGLNTFGRRMHPLAMLAYRDWERGAIDTASLATTLELIQALLLRRMVVGISRDRLVARLCRKWSEGPDALARAAARIMPSDLRVRLALRYRALPHASHVLGRLEGVDAAGLVLEHVFPPSPADDWTGDGVRPWRDYTEDEQNSLRALLPTLGNLALVEEELIDGMWDRSFPDKRPRYAESAVPGTRALAALPTWGSAAVSARTGALADRFVEVWSRPPTIGIDDDGLTPILDALRRPGWYDGWRTEFDYVEYRGEHWEVHDVKHLFRRVHQRIWADHPAEVLAFSARNRGPVYDTQAWRGEWVPLGDSHWLFTGLLPQHLLEATQGLLDELGLADEVFVRYDPL